MFSTVSSDRFRLLSGPRRGLERHQTLRHAVAWSYDLLDDDHRRGAEPLLGVRRWVRSGRSHPHLQRRRLDEYGVLDAVGFVGAQVAGHRRAGRTVTPATGCWRRSGSSPRTISPARAPSKQVQDRHARYFADQATTFWKLWDGPGQRVALDWVDVEFANLRAGFRWATDHSDLGHGRHHRRPHRRALAFGGAPLRGRSAGPRRSSTPRPRPTCAGSLASTPPPALCCYARTPRGRRRVRPQRPLSLAADPRYDPFDAWLERLLGGPSPTSTPVASTTSGGDRREPRCSGLASLASLVWAGMLLPPCRRSGRAEEARPSLRRRSPSPAPTATPFSSRYAFYGLRPGLHRDSPDSCPGRASGRTPPTPETIGSSSWKRPSPEKPPNSKQCTEISTEALVLFETVIDAFYRAGKVATVATSRSPSLAIFFDRFERPEIAATLYGASRPPR